MRLSVFNVSDQRQALLKLAELAEKATVHPLIRETANRIVADCDARDDMCELEALYEAVKYGTPHVKALRKGVRYVADPRWADFFTAPQRLLEQCGRGVCAGDCDDHAALIAALAGAVGFKVGLRVWGQDSDGYTHVYAVAAVSKREPKEVLGLDTTVDEAYVGWEPPPGNVLTAWME